MKNVGKAIVVIGLIGVAGAVDTGYGWFTSSALLGIGTTLLIMSGWKRLNNRKRALI